MLPAHILGASPDKHESALGGVQACASSHAASGTDVHPPEVSQCELPQCELPAEACRLSPSCKADSLGDAILVLCRILGKGKHLSLFYTPMQQPADQRYIYRGAF